MLLGLIYPVKRTEARATEKLRSIFREKSLNSQKLHF